MQLHSWLSTWQRKRQMDSCQLCWKLQYCEIGKTEEYMQCQFFEKKILDLEQELESERRQRMDLQCKLNATKADLQRALHILKKHDSFYDD